MQHHLLIAHQLLYTNNMPLWHKNQTRYQNFQIKNVYYCNCHQIISAINTVLEPMTVNTAISSPYALEIEIVYNLTPQAKSLPWHANASHHNIIFKLPPSLFPPKPPPPLLSLFPPPKNGSNHYLMLTGIMDLKIF